MGCMLVQYLSLLTHIFSSAHLHAWGVPESEKGEEVMVALTGHPPLGRYFNLHISSTKLL